MPHLLAPAASPRRVAFVTVHTSPLDQPGTGDGGGLNVYVREVGRRLAARGTEVDVFTRARSTDLAPTVVLAPGFRVHHIPAGPLVHLDKEELAAHLGEFELRVIHHPEAATYDLVHAHYWLSGHVGRRLAATWGVPFVQSFHTLGLLKNLTLAPGDRPEPQLRLDAERAIARSADRVLGLTCGEGRFLHHRLGLSGADISVVPAGVDLSVFHPEPEPDDAARVAALAPPGDGPLLLFVGRLQPLKGPDVAVRTLATVRRSVPDARLLVVGGESGTGQGRSGPRELTTLADHLGVADAVGSAPAQPQRTLASLYRAAAVVLVPSRSETFGLVALEAQASGTPVVGARVSGLEFVIRAGGILVDGHDPADHAAAVVTLLTDPTMWARRRAAGLADADAASWDRTVDRLEAVYGELAVARAPLERAG